MPEIQGKNCLGVDKNNPLIENESKTDPSKVQN
jgi:hypothetical protein